MEITYLLTSPPLVGGDRGEGDLQFSFSPLPEPFPVKGEGERG